MYSSPFTLQNCTPSTAPLNVTLYSRTTLMWKFVIQTFGLFLLFKYSPTLVRSILGWWKRASRQLTQGPTAEQNMNPDKTSQSNSKKATSTAVTSENAEVAAATAQESFGAASSGTTAAAMASIMSSNTLSSSTARSESSQAYSRFMSGVENCMNQYSQLGSWLSDQICECVDPADIPQIAKQFMGLSPIKRALIVIVLLALVGLVGWMAWEGVGLVWPHIMNFLSSPHGTTFIEKLGTVLGTIAESDVMRRFVTTLTNAALPESSNGDESPPCFETADWTSLATMVMTPTIDIIKLFFAYCTTNMMNK